MGVRSLSALLLLCACAATKPSPPQVAAPAGIELPARWLTCGAWDFERLALELSRVAWSAEARAELGLKLAGPGQDSVRAAVLLSRGDGDSLAILLERLEAREVEEEREGDAAEVVAAAALGALADAELGPRLAALAQGPRAHPDLEVRVECAAAALDLGHGAVIPFLLRVLHAGTPAELEDPVDWTPTDTLAWSKSRAALALSRRAGVAREFRPDGSYAHQIEAARRLEELLLQGP
jgi:hypothetical protein